MTPRQGLEIALIRDPDAIEITVELGAARIGQDRLQRRTGQAPPLRAQMWHQPVGNSPFQPPAALEIHVAVKKLAALAIGKWKAQREAFLVQPAHGPADILGGHAFDEIPCRMLRQKCGQIRHRPQRQARPRNGHHMRQLGAFGQDQRCRIQRRPHQAEGAPLAGMPGRHEEQRAVLQVGRHGRHHGRRNLGIDMDRHRRAAIGPDLGHAGRDGDLVMAQHHHAQTHRVGRPCRDCDRRDHIQLPFEIRPRSSSWRQPS